MVAINWKLTELAAVWTVLLQTMVGFVYSKNMLLISIANVLFCYLSVL